VDRGPRPGAATAARLDSSQLPDRDPPVLDYLLDRRYPWTAICAERLGVAPQQVVDERNLIVHTNEFEADPSRRPLSRDELVTFFDFCDAEAAGRRALRPREIARGAARRGAVQDDLRVGPAPPGGRSAPASSYASVC
jgi:hypothetical protein